MTENKSQCEWQKFPVGFSLKNKIEYLQRKIILNSIAYYMYDCSPLSDSFYDNMGKQLVELQKEYGDVADTRYGYAFYDFEGNTGFYLFYRLSKSDQEYLLSIAEHALKRIK